MPIYEYQCQACGYEFETIQKMSDPKLTDCPKCETASLVKKISAVAFRLKGSGWYETDFKSGQKRQLHEDSSNGDSKSGASGDGDSEGNDSTSEKSESKSSNSSDSSNSSSSSETATSP
ncbi:MAG: zinc ribbon domain-containing protein [Gammaproteobacteria bacterium]|nr:zinc ribbon domain-containing protein [Gammaproteobacteria bacterium]